MKETDGSPAETGASNVISDGVGGGRGLAAALVGAACLGLLGAAAGFAYAFFQYVAVFDLLSNSFRPWQKLVLVCGCIADVAPSLVWATAAAGAWLALLAAAIVIVESVARHGVSDGPPGALSARALRSRRVSAVFTAVATCMIVMAAYFLLQRESRWTAWATIGTVVLAGLFGGLRAHSGDRPPRLPRALLPVMLAASSFQLGAADVMTRWHRMSSALQYYREQALDEQAVGVAMDNQPIGLLALLGPLLVLLTFAAWRSAEGPRFGVRSRAPHELAAVAGLLALSYLGLDRRVRADLGKFTGGSGSNEDLLAYVRVARPYIPDTPTWLWTDP